MRLSPFAVAAFVCCLAIAVDGSALRALQDYMLTFSGGSGKTFTKTGRSGGNGCVYTSGWGYYVKAIDCGYTMVRGVWIWC